MGQLVPIGDSKGKNTAIPLHLPDDGREATLLTVGWQDGCHIKIQGEGIGEREIRYAASPKESEWTRRCQGRMHCYIKLTIGLSADCSSPYVRRALIKPMADYVTTVRATELELEGSAADFISDIR